MRTVRVAASKTYNVYIEHGLIEQTGEILQQTFGRVCKAAVLTDDIVDALYGECVKTSLEKAEFEVCKFVVPHGEEHKNILVWAQMLEFLARNQLTRTDVIIALGGGVVGDMAGFAAAVYLRGISFIQIPTTLLAMVDSSVGGKTAVNLQSGKNLAGAFKQPSVVLCDPHVLQSLTAEGFANGVAEIIKYGVLNDQTLFALLGRKEWHQEIVSVIENCVRSKARFVEEDECDTGNRQLLNLGHTLGHAIEKCSNLAVSHGYAVAIGMVYAAKISVGLGLCSNDTVVRLKDTLTANQLPVASSYSAEELCSAAMMDKKRKGSSITLVLPCAIGECRLYKFHVDKLPELVKMALAE